MIAISGFFLDPSGFGEVTRRYTHALQKAKADVIPGVPLTDNLGQMDPKTCWKWARLDEFIRKKGEVKTHFILVPAAQVPVVRDMIDAPRSVMFTTWETDTLPDSYVSGAAEVDAVIVPCFWNARAYKDRDVEALCIPTPALYPELPVPLEQAGASVRHHLHISDSEYVFYSIGTWQARKNFDGLVTAYFHAFTGYDDVVLLLEISGGKADIALAEQTVDYLRRIAKVPNPPKIIIAGGRNKTDEYMWGLHAAGDCYATMTRGEATGIPILDAATMGRELIVPGQGGHMDYVREYDRLYPVDTLKTPVMQDYVHFNAKQLWYEPNILGCSEAMKAAFDRGRKTEIDLYQVGAPIDIIGKMLAEALYGH